MTSLPPEIAHALIKKLAHATVVPWGSSGCEDIFSDGYDAGFDAGYNSGLDMAIAIVRNFSINEGDDD